MEGKPFNWGAAIATFVTTGVTLNVLPANFFLSLQNTMNQPRIYAGLQVYSFAEDASAALSIGILVIAATAGAIAGYLRRGT